MPKSPRGLMTLGALLALPVLVASLTLWKMRAEAGLLTAAAQQILNERDQARKSEAVFKNQFENDSNRRNSPRPSRCFSRVTRT